LFGEVAMNRSPSLIAPGLSLLISLASVAIADAPAPTMPAELEQKAIALYEQGRFAEARPLLEQLDASGAASGVVLYRLAYCQRKAQDAAAPSTEQRARERLERDFAGARDLEIPFYLVNVYQNQGQRDRARQVAAETTARLERGELPSPKSGLDQFRMAKLLADQGNDDGAATWYRKAV